jgi:hypothetical protein
MNFSISVLFVRRIDTANEMEVVFQISPDIPALSLISFQKFITTNVPSTSVTSSYENGLLTVIFNYNQTI